MSKGEKESSKKLIKDRKKEKKEDWEKFKGKKKINNEGQGEWKCGRRTEYKWGKESKRVNKKRENRGEKVRVEESEREWGGKEREITTLPFSYSS